jgi:NAD(P)-dependent dehydrogenase (short-subunit alcohol dehydrogenase family)
MTLMGKVAIVTGSSRGIGKSISMELARAGATVVIAARTVDAGKSALPGTIFTTLDEIREIGGKAIAIKCDVKSEPDINEMIKQVNSQLGQIDIIVNNAGITTPESFQKIPIEKWDLVLEVNLRGTFLCTKYVLPHMIERKSGHIINMSSILAQRIQYSIPYGVSKAAIERFTLGLAKEMKKYNIAVNALRPDFTLTEAVNTFMPDMDTSGWQDPNMWGKYTVLIAQEDANSLTGCILDEAALKKRFGAV